MELTFLATGIYDVSGLRVVSASGRKDCAARGGKLILNTGAGERVSIEMTFEQDYDGPIEMFAVRSTEL